MAESGCKALFIGFESIDEETVKFTGKRQNKPSQYKETMDMLHDHGIATWGSFVFGFDTDSKTVFDRTVDFGIEMKLTMALFAILTPYPGTRLFKRLAEEGRLTNDRWWLEKDHDRLHPFYKPAQMSAEQLKTGWVRAWRQMYSYPNIARRFDPGFDHSWIQNVAYWPINLMMHELAERKIAKGDKEWRKHRALEIPFGL